MQFDLFDQTHNKVFAAPTYAEFKKELLSTGCTQCALSKSRTQIVIDRGNPESKILIVGEGPGEQEDLKGEAFVGK
ncbi:MAG: uracil-DNA glycosylase family protein, partial [Candidatus Omnitrophota bacterium]